MTMTAIPENERVIQVPLSSVIGLKEAGYTGSALLRGLDDDNVEHLIATNLENVPPITVAQKGNQWVIVDGHHRVEAARQLEKETIAAIVKVYPSDNHMLDAAFQANMQHGLVLSRADKENYVLWLSKTFPDMAQTTIADRVKLTQATVSRIISRHKRAIEEAQRAKEVDNEEEDENEDTRDYAVPQINHTKKLLVSMAGFFENEKTLFGSIKGARSEQKRAKALAAMVSPDEEVADMFDSLSRSLMNAASLVRDKILSLPISQTRDDASLMRTKKALSVCI